MNLIELQRALGQLRLGGVAAVLETRLRQAQAEPMAPIDLISCLVTDELTRRSDRLLERRRKQAAFRDPQRTLDNFDFSFNPKMNRSLVFDLATCAFIGKREDALFLGPGGTGKSHLAQAIGQAAIQQGYRVLYRETHVLLDDLAEAVSDGTRKEFMESLTTVPLLIIDDFGMRKLPMTAAEDLLEIVMRRYERFSTLLTSNRPVEPMTAARLHILTRARISPQKDEAGQFLFAAMCRCLRLKPSCAAFHQELLIARSESTEPCTIATGRGQAVGLSNQRFNLRCEDAYYVCFRPDMVDQFQKISPGNIRLCLDENHLLGAIAHDLSQPLSDFGNRRIRLHVQLCPMASDCDSNDVATFPAGCGRGGHVNEEAFHCFALPGAGAVAQNHHQQRKCVDYARRNGSSVNRHRNSEQVPAHRRVLAAVRRVSRRVWPYALNRLK
jgi:DNA replication protein DnaC